MKTLMIGLWMACALGAQAQQRDVLFRRADGQPRTWGLSVEALYGAYLLEPITIYTEHPLRPGVSGGKRSYGRYSDRWGGRVNANFFGNRLIVSVGWFRSVLKYETTPVLWFDHIFENSYLRQYYAATQEYVFSEFQLGLHGGVGSKRLRFEFGASLIAAQLSRKQFEFRQTGYEVYIPNYAHYDVVTTHHDLATVHQLPRNLPLYSLELRLKYRLWGPLKCSLSVHNISQFSPINCKDNLGQPHANDFDVRYPPLGFYRAGVTFGFDLNLY